MKKSYLLFLSILLSGCCVFAQQATQLNLSDASKGFSSPTNLPIIPALFTPNGDGENDLWVIANLANYPNHRLTVYSRWGTVVYMAAPYLNDWDGSDMNAHEPLPEGSYHYLFESGHAKLGQLKGYITIVK